MLDLEKFQSAIDLAKQNRINAAKRLWEEVTDKQKILDYVLFLVSNPSEPMNETVTLVSQRYGKLVLSDTIVQDIKSNFMRLIHG